MMLSVSPRHSGSRVYGDSIASLTTSSGGRSASISRILVRCTMTSDTGTSESSSRPPNMSRSLRSTSPSRCRMSTAPISSSCPDTPGSVSVSDRPQMRRIKRTSASTATTIGLKTVTKNMTTGAIASETRSG